MSDVSVGSPVTHEWQRWAAISLLHGVPLAEVISTMVAEGVSEEEAAVACAECFGNAIFEAGKHSTQQLRKLESVLSMMQMMRSLSSVPREIDRRSGLSRDEFLDEYYSQNKPVILEDVCNTWPARELWTPQYLAEKLGSEEVEVMADRESDPEYELNSNEHKYRMPFDEYVAKITATDWSNDLYLVANNKLFESEASAPLWEDFTEDPRYLTPDERHVHTFLWFGPAGTVTPLHHDTMNVLFHQIDGWKRFILISPLETHCVYNSVAVYSDVDPKSPDLERFGRFGEAHPIEFSVGPGEVLFIPVGWWHHVEALELSISLSSTSFAFPNDVTWVNPQRL
jgi:ribosomal protein L16 Arg81 hydroxylase